MAVNIGSSGVMGIALETVQGTYVAPTKYFPFESESLHWTQDTVWRRPIRNAAGVVGAVPGYGRVEGDITAEAFEDALTYFLYAARTTPVKTGSSNYTYTFTPSPNATPSKTMSITIVRNGVTFGYTGCTVGGFALSIADGMLKATYTILGRDEATQATPTATWATTPPFGAGQQKLEIPTGSVVLDTDTFEFTVDDGAEAAYRIKDTGRGAQFVKFGEHSLTMSMERDFETRTDYDAFKALTAQSITMTASKGANNGITLVAESAIKESYEVGLSGQGDLIRASIAYQGVQNASGNTYTITTKNQENIT